MLYLSEQPIVEFGTTWEVEGACVTSIECVVDGVLRSTSASHTSGKRQMAAEYELDYSC